MPEPHHPSTPLTRRRATSTASSAARPDPWDGAPWTPRRWQAAALPAVLAELDAGRRSIVSAVMGSGKSVLIAEVAHQWLGGDTVVITTPTQALVDQLAGTLRERLGDDQVGRFFTHAKEIDRPVVVACNASAALLAAELSFRKRTTGLWIADEVHRTETAQMLQAALTLQPHRQLGFTATPFRSDDRERLRLWDSVAFRYSLADALRDQVLVPWSVVPWDGEGDDDLDAVCLRLIRHHAQGPGMVNAADIGDAEQFARLLNERGLRADTVHSRRSASDNAAALAALEGGDLDCIVHVNMLAEGVDLPWLRWLCLRRPMCARVRFIQEVGRVLRAAPGKDRAVLLDPHDLFGAFGWGFGEALGEWEREKGAPREPVEREPGEMRSATATDPLSAYCRRLLLPLQAAGWASASKVVADEWRRDLPTDKQLDYLRVCRRWRPWRWLPGDHARLVADLLGRPGDLTRGAVSDLIAISQALSQRRAYPVEAGVVELPAAGVIAGLARGEASGNGDPRWYVAGVWTSDHAEVAIVVFHGGRVVGTWTRRRRLDEDWTALQVAAIHAGLHLAARRERAPIVIATQCSLAAAVANRETAPIKPALRRALRALESRFGTLSFRVEVIAADANPAPLYGFRALRRSGPPAPVEAP